MVFRKILTTLALIALLPTAPAQAESFLFAVRSDYPYIVHIAFYSDDRNWVWPNGDEVYVLDDSRVHDFSLTCQYGEKICYGAWPKGSHKTYWGVGPDRSQRCSDCCYYCQGGESGVIVLYE
ncbi:hypothetical protein [Shimia sp.]|uniref:hypothetical protein n=1 Tax=Shimia sp. TaxID=1954381 RepID=UPI00356606BB